MPFGMSEIKFLVSSILIDVPLILKARRGARAAEAAGVDGMGGGGWGLEEGDVVDGDEEEEAGEDD